MGSALKKRKYAIGAVAPRPPLPLTEEEITSSWSSAHEKPLVSILCACYNHESFIEDALNGFLMQRTDFPFEVIINDDASTDGSVEIINKYARLYPKIIKPILQTENQYGKGIKAFFFTSGEAKGKYFALCEGDDYWLDETKLQAQADFLDEHPSFSLCGHDAFVIEDGAIRAASIIPKWDRRDASKKRLSYGPLISTLTTMFRAGINPNPAEVSRVTTGDAFLFSRLGTEGKFKFLSNISPGAYRVHSGGIWSSIDQKLKSSLEASSSFWIAQYYARIGQRELSIHFAQKSALRALNSVDYMRPGEFVKFTFKVYVQLVLKLAKSKSPRFYSFFSRVRR